MRISATGSRIDLENVVIAASAAPRLGDNQISRRSLCALGCIDFGSLSSTFNVLCSQHR